MERGEPEGKKTRASGERGSGPEKECETKDDGRYIIFYAFEDEEAGESRPVGEESD